MKNEEKQIKENHPSFFNGLLLGAAVGAAGYFFFGTKKGKRVKKALKKGSIKTFEDLKKTAKDLEKKGKKLSKKAAVKKAKFEKKANLTQKKVVAEIRQAEKELALAKKKAERLKEKFTKTTTAVKKRYFTKKGKSLRK